MAEYIDRNLIEWYGCDYENADCENRECSGCSFAECSHSQVMQIPTADVIERSEIDKAIKEIEDYNIKTNFANCSEAFQLGVTRGLDLASEILKRNIGE